MTSTLCFRLNADSKVGTGHLMRCIAVALRLRSNIDIVFFCNESPIVRAMLEKYGFDLTLISGGTDETDAEQCLSAMRKVGSSTLLLDSYSHTDRYIQMLRRAKISVIAFDDLGDRPLFPTLLINTNLYADSLSYPAKPGTRYFVGPSYHVIRGEFERYVRSSLTYSRVRHVLFTFGGADPLNHTLRALNSFILAIKNRNAASYSLTILVGGANRNFGELSERVATLCQEIPKLSIRLVCNPSNVAPLFSSSEVVVSSAGTTALELAFLRIPMILVPIAKNQIRVADSFAKCGAGIVVSPHTIDSLGDIILSLLSHRAQRRSLMDACKKLRIGCDSEKFLGALKGYCTPMVFRRAELGDARRLYVWRNDPQTRLNSFSPKKIAYKDHLGWFRSSLHNPSRVILIAGSGGRLVGTIRFDFDSKGGAEMSITVARAMRKKGMGSQLLSSGCHYAAEILHLRTLVARTKPENIASQKAFWYSGFHYVTREPVVVMKRSLSLLTA